MPKQNPKPSTSSPSSQPRETMAHEGLAKKKQAASTQKFLNFQAIRDGIVVLNNGNLRGIVMVSSVNFSLLSFEEQKGKVYAYQDFLNGLEFPIQILVQSRTLNIRRYLEKVRESARLQENDLLRTQMEEYQAFIAQMVELANITSNHFYVTIPFTAAPGKVKEGIFSKLTSFASPAGEISKERDAFGKEARELQLRVNAVIGGLRGAGLQAAQLTTQEIVELLYTWYNPTTGSAQMLASLDQLRIERA